MQRIKNPSDRDIAQIVGEQFVSDWNKMQDITVYGDIGIMGILEDAGTIYIAVATKPLGNRKFMKMPIGMQKDFVKLYGTIHRPAVVYAKDTAAEEKIESTMKKLDPRGTITDLGATHKCYYGSVKSYYQ